MSKSDCIPEQLPHIVSKRELHGDGVKHEPY